MTFHRDSNVILPPSDFNHALTRSPQLVIKQIRELTEIFLGFETRNKYAIFDDTGAPCGTLVERGSGVGHFLRRIFFRSHRPFEIDIFNSAGQPSLALSRPFFFFFSDIAVTRSTGEFLGSAHRRFGFINKRYDLRDAQGNTFATVRSSLFKIWTFAIRDVNDQEVARISKKWTGVLKEVFTDADNFLVEFGTASWSPSQRAVILATSISVDFDFFENNNRQ
jgi:hypothetical protein